MGIFARRGAKACAIAFAGALAFGASASALDNDGDEINVDGDVDEVVEGMFGPNIYRFADEDRVGTALQAAQRTTIGDGGWGNTVIIASTEVFADALAATPLADVLDAPVLLNKPGSTLDPRVSAYINGNFNNVILVGGTDVFGASLQNALELDFINVDRASGANRYQTARELALMALANVGEESMDAVNVFLASGLDFPDALAAGAAAANNDGIVLLTKGAEGLDKATYDSLRLDKFGDWEQNSIIAVGGPAAAAVQSGWDNTPIEVNDTVVGDNRYETATLLAAEYVADASNAVIASGENFPDGVVGGAFASNVDGPLLLTKEDSLTKVTREYLEDNRNDFNGTVNERGNIFVFGGVNSISKNVSVQLASLEWTY